MDTENSGEERVSSRTDPNESDQSTLVTRPAPEDASRLGLSMTLVTGLLLALAYYGLQSVNELGFGHWVPEPFYMLAFAVLFVVELSRRSTYDARELAAAIATTAVYGTLVALAVEGSAYLWDSPGAALDEFQGVAVLAVSVVVAALAYVLYLAVTETN